MVIKAIIQARMGSSRFPGKVLAPFRGEPILKHVMNRAIQAVGVNNVVVAISDQPADTPIRLYVNHLMIPCFCGSLDNVYFRFWEALKRYPCKWFFRICADSPLLNVETMKQMQEMLLTTRVDGEVVDPPVDIFTNVHPRTFPQGKSVELIRTNAFLGLNGEKLSESQREHPTKFFYDHPQKFRILNIRAEENRSHERLVVDTVEDLQRLENLEDHENRQPSQWSSRLSKRL
jgi:spore coat polysaccharide biosynthesis protein SpsF